MVRWSWIGWVRSGRRRRGIRSLFRWRIRSWRCGWIGRRTWWIRRGARWIRRRAWWVRRWIWWICRRAAVRVVPVGGHRVLRLHAGVRIGRGLVARWMFLLHAITWWCRYVGSEHRLLGLVQNTWYADAEGFLNPRILFVGHVRLPFWRLTGFESLCLGWSRLGE